MKQTNFFPIERNHYFFGKLLTDRDFTSEQDYFNNKRRLINRFVFGMGVVSGLGVLKVDDKTISVEAGLAIDSTGREVVVDSPSMRKLTMIDGYDRMSPDQPYLYLCLEYDEEESGSDYSPANTRGDQFSKYHESYRLYLTQEEPKENLVKKGSAMLGKTVLYQGNGLVITEQTPKLMGAEERRAVVLRLENHGQRRAVSLTLRQSLSLLKTEDGGGLAFQETLTLGEGEVREFSADILALPVKEDAEARIAVEEWQLTVDGRTCICEKIPPRTVFLTAGSREGRLEKRYFEESFERIYGSGLYERLYLARVHVISVAEAYMIDRVESLPFDQYILTGELLKGFLDLLREGRSRAGIGSGAAAAGSPAAAEAIQSLPRESSGSVVIPLGIGAKAGQCFYSGELVHGLGTGMVDVSLEIEEEEFLYAGDRSVFASGRGTVYSLGARINQKAGTFCIGVRAEQPTVDTELKVHWSAKAYDSSEKRDRKKQIYILPEHIELKTYESIALEARTKNLDSDRALWRVKDQASGSVDENGVYTAPGIEGIYEVEAIAEEDPTVRNTTFIIVRER